jgi:uncharacterized protein (TIRG00374 family)
MKKRQKNRQREEAIEYLNPPSWDKAKRESRSLKRFDVHFTSTEKEKLDEIEEKVELYTRDKKGKRKKVLQIFFLIFFSVVSLIILSFIDNSGAVPLGQLFEEDAIKVSWLLFVLLMLAVVILFDTFKYIYLIRVTTKKFRPFTSFKVGIVGRYYDSITPLATGGQLFQMYYLAKRDVPVGVASAIPLLRFFIGQIANTLVAVAFLVFVTISPDVSAALDPTTFAVTQSAAIVGLALNSSVPIFLLFLTLMPKIGRRVTSGIIKLGARLKFIKDYETTFNNVIKHVEEFQTSMRYVSSNPFHILMISLLSVVEYLAFISVPYFVCVGFGMNPSFSLYLSIVSLNLYTIYAVSMMPTPGTSGAAETVFLLVFRTLIPVGAFWAMLIWRFMTYYIFIILGLVVMFYDFIKQTTKEKFIERRKLFNIREKLIPKLNSQSAVERLATLTVLKQIEKDDKFFIPAPREHDVKISFKSEYSNMPFNPSYLAYKLHAAGCQIGGIMDYLTMAGAKEFYKACEILGMKPLLGVEATTYISRYKKRDLRINHLYQKDVINLCMTCIPYHSIDFVDEWLKRFRERRNEKNRKMVELINKKYRQYGIELDFDKDVLPVSLYGEGGTVTEWHLLYALAQKLIEKFGRGQILLRFLTHELHIILTEKMKQNLLDVTDNKIYIYDLVNILRAEIWHFYVDAADECCSILEFIKVAKDTGSLVCYRYIGDIIQNVMGEYRVEKFEDSFLDELISELKELGVNAVMYEPSRLTDEQLKRIGELCEEHEMIQLSGETIYSIRQGFRNDVLDDERFDFLVNNAWALVGNVRAMDAGKESSIVSSSTIEKYPQLSTRLMIYSALGKYGKFKEA